MKRGGDNESSRVKIAWVLDGRRIAYELDCEQAPWLSRQLRIEAACLRQRQGLRCGHIDRYRHEIIDDLHSCSTAGGSAMHDGVAELLQRRSRPVQIRLSASDHDEKLALNGVL